MGMADGEPTTGFGDPGGSALTNRSVHTRVKSEGVMRRFTRLTNGFSKKIQNLEYVLALHFMYYNFARVHKTLRVTPAMEAGITDYVWTIEEIVNLIN